jgi:hypothetical protein
MLRLWRDTDTIAIMSNIPVAQPEPTNTYSQDFKESILGRR